MSANFKVIINYSESDNNPDINSGKGWIDNFKRFLSLMLEQVVGSRVEVVMCPGGEGLPKGLLASADMMVCLISPYFIDNPDCMDTLEGFYQAKRKNDNVNRIFKVLKSPIKVQEQPMRLREMIGYEMFHFDEDSQESEEFEAFITADAESGREFWMKMVDLVYDMDECYIEIKGEGDQDKVRPLGDRKTVYLAETGQDLTIQRNIIKRELQRFGFKVVPSQALPPALDAFENQVKEDLEVSSLAIHLIGSSFGYAPDGSQKSIIDIQNRLAAEWSRSNLEKNKGKDDTLRFIWISPNLRAAGERQLTFIENIKRDVAALEGAEILQTPLEDFKNIIREELFSEKAKLRGLNRMVDDGGGSQKVYLIHDRVDQPSIEPIKNQIEKMGYSVLEPSFKGNLLDLRQDHIQNLRKLDFALIYQGQVNDQWVKMKLLDLLKAPGFGRNKPILNKGVVVSKFSKGEFDKLNNDKRVDVIHESGSEPPVNDIKKFLQTRQQVL